MILSKFYVSPDFPRSYNPINMHCRPIVMNAVEYVVFPGAVNKDTRYQQLHLKISDRGVQNFSPECEC